MCNIKTWTIAALVVLLLLSAAFPAFASKKKNPPAATQDKPVATPAGEPAVGDSSSCEPNAVPESNSELDSQLTAFDLSPQPYINMDPSSQILRERLEELKDTALNFLGAPYRWGGTTPNAFDCSGFTRYVYKKMGVILPRTAREQYKAGKPVKAGNWQTGDLVFFDIKKGRVSHVGLYLTSCAFIHASNPMSGVKIDNLKEPYYKRYYVGARKYDLT